MTRSNGGFWADFRKFIMQGNVVDLAVAVIIGAAFGKIVTSFIEDIITPLILNPVLQQAGVDDIKNLSANGIKYGSFLAAVLDFLVIALVIFLLIRALEKAKKRFQRQAPAEEVAAAPDPAIVAQERTVAALDRLTRAIESRGL